MKSFYLTLFILCFTGVLLSAQTPGELTVSVATSETGGNYAPKNIIAIWIEDDAGNFVKTLLAYAQNRRTHLNTWQAVTNAAGSEYNTVDAITGATRPNHSTRECNWNATDIDGQVVADGTYHIWMELTDKNNTGNFSSFAFTKGELSESLTPDDVPSFASIEVNWVPSDPTTVTEVRIGNKVSIYPNPGKGLYTIRGNNILEVVVKNSSGKEILRSDSKTIDISDQPNGVYLIETKTDQGIVINKVVKQ